MKKLNALIGLTLLCGISLALTVNVSVDPSAWDGSLRGQPTAPLLEPGVPALNYYPVRVLIPFGEPSAKCHTAHPTSGKHSPSRCPAPTVGAR